MAACTLQEQHVGELIANTLLMLRDTTLYILPQRNEKEEYGSAHS